jgi:hypothetical protein
MDKIKWGLAEQSIYECALAGLVGSKRIGILTLEDYDKMLNKIQTDIDEKTYD